jgi:hypothetical protein
MCSRLTLTPNEARPPVPDVPQWVTDPAVRDTQGSAAGCLSYVDEVVPNGPSTTALIT